MQLGTINNINRFQMNQSNSSASMGNCKSNEYLADTFNSNIKITQAKLIH